MKKIISFLFIWMIGLISAQGIEFDQSSYSELLNKAKKENKLVFVDAYAAWCGPCKLMSKNVFTKKEVADFYNNNFINAKIDMEKGEGRTLAKRFSVYSYPTYLFINGDGQVVSRGRGYVQPHHFIEIGKQALKAITNNSDLKKKLSNGENDPKVLKEIIKTYATTDYNLAKQASERYFSNKKDPFTQEDINLLIPFIKSKKDSNFIYLVDHKEEITKIIPESDYKLVKQQILVSDIFIRYTNEKTATLDNEEKALSELAEIMGKQEADKIMMRYKLSLYQNTNPEKFIDTAISYFQNKENHNTSEIMQVSWYIAEKSNNKKAIKTATEWMEGIVMQNENAENTFILATLYHKAGKNKEAKMFAESSINLSNGKKMILAEKLLDKLQ